MSTLTNPVTVHSNGIHELAADVSSSRYYNADMAPTTLAQRKWGMRDFAVLWISMAACITTYTLASALIADGMSWWQAVLTILLGNVIVLIPMVLNAHAGTKYGIPFPVYCRAAFGMRGANIPAILRALVACGWFGIQTWIGGWAIYKIAEIYFPAWKQIAPIGWLGISLPQLGCFLFFWAINVFVIFRGIESIRFLLNIKAPLLIAMGLLLLWWAYRNAGGFGPILSQPSRLSGGEFWKYFFPALTGAVGYWATLSLNIPDFTRYAYSQRDQVIGQALGLPTTMALYAFIGVAVTSAAIIIFPGTPASQLWDPVVLVTHFRNPAVLIVGLVALTLATLATNIAANVVSPANDFAHVWPKAITFKIGGLITALIGVVMMPWHLYNDPNGYIFRWLIAYSALLGAVGGVLIADYYILRRTVLDLRGLYERSGPYWFAGGINWRAIVALAAGIAPCAPGFLGTVGLMTVAPVWVQTYHYAWFISFAVAGAVHVVLAVVIPARSIGRPSA